MLVDPWKPYNRYRLLCVAKFLFVNANAKYNLIPCQTAGLVKTCFSIHFIRVKNRCLRFSGIPTGRFLIALIGKIVLVKEKIVIVQNLHTKNSTLCF